MTFQPRPAQKEILGYHEGMMGVSAVPGSGKTYTLSRLAAKLIMEKDLEDHQEILIVTLVNSAVDNFSKRVSTFIEEKNLLPKMGYRVRTLHGLARDIISERPALVGLADSFEIIDERASDQLLGDVVTAWLGTEGETITRYLLDDMDEGKRDWVSRKLFPDMVRGINRSFIKRAKDYRLTPDQVALMLEKSPGELPLAQMGYQVYQEYQRGLAYRGAVDFDDLIRLALEILEIDPDLLARLRDRWPFILEDEAQDSSLLQEEILKLLAGHGGNWVRVGDPNQAIYETFTTANPQLLIDFIDREDVFSIDLPESGRSTRSIIDLANYLILWTNQDHPVPALNSALKQPYIKPTGKGDPQPNPPDDPTGIRIIPTKFTPDQEIDAVVKSVQKWLPQNLDKSVAILVPRNTRGFKVAEALKEQRIPHLEMLRSVRATRETAGALTIILQHLADPQDSRKLSIAFRVVRRDDREDENANKRLSAGAKLLRSCRKVESFLWSHPGEDWLEQTGLEEDDPQLYNHLESFRKLIQRWHQATSLPIDQLLLTIAQDLFAEQAELALTHKLALLLKRANNNNPGWRLPELSSELGVIAKNERRFLGFSDDDLKFEPDEHPGEVVVTTAHKAKGLEWDRVYLMSVSNYDYPSAQEFDQYISEKWFIRDRLDLQEETLAQLDALRSQDAYQWYTEGEATEKARLAYASERLRLLYVGITRARRELVITYNTGQRSNNTAAIPLEALRAYWEAKA